jgi:alpha 1,6-mannosyltransferase
MRNMSLMIGVEIDEPYLSPRKTAQWGWTRSFGFGQFVIWAPKRFDPMMRTAIVRAISHVKVLEKLQDRSWSGRIRGKKVEMGEATGASMFTDVVLEVLSQSLREDHRLRDWDAGLERRVTWKWFRGLKKPVWIEPRDAREGAEEEMRGLAVLPIDLWSNGQRHSGAGTFDVEDACVNHVYGRMPWKEGWREKIFG